MRRLALALLLFAQPALATPAPTRPEDRALPTALEGVGFDQRLGQALPLDARFADERGAAVQLGDYFRAGRPVILAFAYYRCPMLCNQVLHGLAETLSAVPFEVGRDFEVVIVSIDPREGPEVAAARRAAVAGSGWHFLTGEAEAIGAATRAAGFRYTFDAALDLFAHASGIVVATPEGRLSRYFYGIEYRPTDIRLGLVEASDRRIGSPVDELLLYCYRYDPEKARYGAAVLRLVRIAGLLSVAGIVLLVVLLRRSEGRRGVPARGAV